MVPSASARSAGSAATRAVAVRTLVILGDSTAVGLGDPRPGGGWRGFPALLGTALGADVVNLARIGARMGGVRREQLAAALAAVADGPAVAVLFAGMNDTLRSDFDPDVIERDAVAVVEQLQALGVHVLTIRYHDHTRVFRLPGPLRRALQQRIAALNGALDALASGPGVAVLDLHALPGGYHRAAWAVDRLHPSELGHRLLATALCELVADAGFAVAEPVSLLCGGGRPVTSTHRMAWLVLRGLPWLVRRARDLGPVIVQGIVDGMRRPAAVPCSGGAGTGPGGLGQTGLDLPQVRPGAGGAQPGQHAVRAALAGPGQPGEVGGDAAELAGHAGSHASPWWTCAVAERLRPDGDGVTATT